MISPTENEGALPELMSVKGPQMESEREEIERRRRDMSRIVWILLPVVIVFFLFLLREWFWLRERPCMCFRA